MLHARWWAKQAEIAEALRRPPYKVLVTAAHGVGKTHLAGGLVNHHFDCHPRGVCITTAPTDREVKDLLWKEVRIQRAGRGGFRGQAAPELWGGEEHYAKGFTAAKGESFQGRHPEYALFIFDEAVGVKSFVWQTTRTMFAPTGKHAWLAIGNPTDTTSEMYAEAMSGNWTTIQMSALDHPNIEAELRGEGPLYPAAVRLAQVNEQIRDWSTPIPAEDATATDVLWPPVPGTPYGEPRWYRPGPECEARVLGRWPSSATYGVWSDILWGACENAKLAVPADAGCQVGCDVARHGDDWTAIHARKGPCSLHHERGNGWDTVRTATRCMELARDLAARFAPERASAAELEDLAKQIPVAVDDTGVGGGVTDVLRANGFLAVPVNAAEVAQQDLRYPDVRSELWFAAAALAKAGRLDVSRLAQADRTRLRVQALAPEWAPDVRGRRRVEPKAKTKERCQGRSPDDMDALNLAYYPVGDGSGMKVVPRPKPDAATRKREGGRRLFGR